MNFFFKNWKKYVMSLIGFIIFLVSLKMTNRPKINGFFSLLFYMKFNINITLIYYQMVVDVWLMVEKDINFIVTHFQFCNSHL